MFYVTEDISKNLVSVETLSLEDFFIEINLRGQKNLLLYSSNPHRDNISIHLKFKIYIYHSMIMLLYQGVLTGKKMKTVPILFVTGTF